MVVFTHRAGHGADLSAWFCSAPDFAGARGQLVQCGERIVHCKSAPRISSGKSTHLSRATTAAEAPRSKAAGQMIVSVVTRSVYGHEQFAGRTFANRSKRRPARSRRRRRAGAATPRVAAIWRRSTALRLPWTGASLSSLDSRKCSISLPKSAAISWPVSLQTRGGAKWRALFRDRRIHKYGRAKFDSSRGLFRPAARCLRALPRRSPSFKGRCRGPARSDSCAFTFCNPTTTSLMMQQRIFAARIVAGENHQVAERACGFAHRRTR